MNREPELIQLYLKLVESGKKRFYRVEVESV